MAIKTYKPTSPARRQMTSQDFDGITTKKPLKSLLMTKKGAAGRNNQGRITTRHKGGGVRQHYRAVSFSLPKDSKLTVEHIEYDPNRSARIARVKDEAGVYYYVLASRGMRPGNSFVVAEEGAIESGNRLPLANIPAGTQIHAIELQPGKGAQLVRSAGVGAQLVAKEGDYAQVRLPSGEVRMIPVQSMATIGVLGNEQHQNIQYGKAGRMRHKGVRPTVRGVVMAAADHPHGGGDGGRHGTAKDPRTPWGQKTLGYKTRSRRKSSKFIVRTRHEAKKR